MTNHYPEDIYITPVHKTRVENSLAITSDSVIKMVERAYDLGKTHATQDTADWHDLTAAIKAGEPIDWKALDGRRAKCEHKTMGALVHKLVRCSEFPADSAIGWVELYDTWCEALDDAWHGYGDWTLYIDGPVPIKRKTADQLKPGTLFTALHEGDEVEFIVYEERSGNRFARPLNADNPCDYFDDQVEVIEEYGVGTFKVGDGEV